MYPTFRILANQNDITDKIKDRLLSLELHDEINSHADSLTLRLDNRPPYIVLPKTSATLDAYLGSQKTGPDYKGQYKVDTLELSAPFATFIIRARAANFKDNMKTLKNRSFDKITLQQLITTLAQEHYYESILALN